ncbi:hypothetical protein SBADM41S_04257 [Streptomyces badius]
MRFASPANLIGPASSVLAGNPFPVTPYVPRGPRTPSRTPVASGEPRRSAAPCRRSWRSAPSVVITLPSAQVGAYPRCYSSVLLGTDTQSTAPNPTRSPTGVVTITCVSVIPLVFTSGWASGINAYAVVLLLGVFGATGVSDEVPAALQRTDVLIVAGVLFLCEAIADKIPYVDSVWDTAHTVIRPVAGAVIAALLAGESGSLPELAAGAIGGSTALMSHLVKAGTRMAVNTSPEPFSNVAMSVAEDLGVAGVVTFAIFNPVAAAVIAAVLLVLGIVTVVFLASRIRRFLRRRAQRREEKGLAGTGAHWPPG